MTRREPWTLLGDILAAVAASSEADGARLPVLTTRANLPHDRLVAYLRELEAHGLVENVPRPRLKAAGSEFVREYRDWLGVLTRFGLGEALPLGPPITLGLPPLR